MIPRFSALLILLFFLPILVSAQSLNLTAQKTSYNSGDSFLVSLYINTNNQPINTLSGTIRVSSDKLRITETRYGNSIITLWVERPNVNSSAGTISFAGGVPGGFNGSSGPILNFVVKALSAGQASIGLDDINVLLNDGFGTALDNVTLGKLNFTIKSPPPPLPVETTKEEEDGATEKPEESEIYAFEPDTVSPEGFAPIVSRNPSIAENNYFVSFFAVDKDSGIDYYEVKEKPLILSVLSSRFDTPWINTESPYIISRQYLTREVLVRAYDQAGNFREEKVLKPLHPIVMWIFIVLWTLLVVAGSYFYFRPKASRTPVGRKSGKRVGKYSK